MTLAHVCAQRRQWATSPNIFYIRTGEIVYYAAAVGIVYNKATHTQRFFMGHDDDIQCLAVHPNRLWVATGQMGKDPAVLVWDSGSMQQLVKINHG
jgi:WD40 repeat protein